MGLAKMKRLASSLVVKLGLVVVLLGGAAAASVVTAILVFSSLSKSVDHAVETVLPQVNVAKDVIRLSSETTSAVNALSSADTNAARIERFDAFTNAVSALETRAGNLPEAAQAEILSAIEDVRDEVRGMDSAITERLRVENKQAGQIKELQAFSIELGDLLAGLKTAARSDLSAAGDGANQTIQDALNSIVGTELTRLSTLMAIRAELNLALGATVAFLGSENTESAELYREMARAAKGRMNEKVAMISGEAYFFGRLRPIIDAETQVRSALTDPQFSGSLLSTSLVEAHGIAEDWIVEQIDTLQQGLVIRAEDVGAENQATINRLVGAEVSKLTEAAELDALFKQILIDAILVSTVDDVSALEPANAKLSSAMFSLYSTIEWGSSFPEDVIERLRGLGGITHETTGVVATRRAYLSVRSEVLARTVEVSEANARIAGLARVVSRRSLADMQAAGEAAVNAATAAQERLLQIAVVMAMAGVVAIAVALFLVVRPLQRVTLVTERLSTGDLAPVEGFDRTGGEIGRMATALKVFRDGMIERQALEAQERVRAEADRAAEAQRAEERREAEQQEAARDAARVAEDQRREAEARQRQQASERSAQEERDARAQEQEQVVEALANGLRRLSEGDLTVAITQAFPGGYDGLRVNFNEAVDTLADVIRRLTDSAGNVNASSNELAASAEDMAARTERNAASLEETSAAVLELDATAKSTSNAADEVNTVMEDARGQAETSQTTVTNAVSTMAEIKESSTAISKIVDMIEEIAFQTNLLALNAGVEAARAGDEGRGFGVVASEVRALAQRSSEAAAEINGLITSTRDQISRGVAQVGDAGDALTGILGLIANISDHVSGIAGAAQEQSATISEISGAVSRIEEETQRNSAVFEESLAASELLRSEARTLSGLAENFSTGGGAKRGASEAA